MTDEYKPLWAQLAQAPPPGLPDMGALLLDKIQADLQMDDDWLVRTGRSLKWWGEDIPLVFSVDEPREAFGEPSIKLTIASTVVTDVTASTDQVLALLDQINHVASVGTFVWLENERRVDAFLTHYHHPGVEPITHLMSAFGLLLYGEVIGRSRTLADELGGTRNVVPHPDSGERTDYDEMMTFTETQVFPVGERPNAWHGGELEEVAEYLSDHEMGAANGGPDGLTVEFALARNPNEVSTRLKSHFATGGNFEDDPIATFFSMPTALGQLLCVAHPGYGNGLMSLLRFPIRTDDDAIRFANDFNLGEYRGQTGIPALGAWCADSPSGLAHSGFIPNYYHQDWVALNLAVWAGARTTWAFEAMAPDLIENDMSGGAS